MSVSGREQMEVEIRIKDKKISNLKTIIEAMEREIARLQKKRKKKRKNTRTPQPNVEEEKLAAYCHDEQWSGWMKYLFEKGWEDGEGNYIIPKEWYFRWWNQVKTKYKDLPEEMKESDRKEAKAIVTYLKEK